MVKNRRQLMKKVICIAVTCIVCSQLHTMTVFAKQANWQLRFNPAWLPSQNLKSWAKEDVTVLNRTTFHVDEVGGGADILGRTSNGLICRYKKEGSTWVDAAKGMSIRMEVQYYLSGTSANSPHGYYRY